MYFIIVNIITEVVIWLQRNEIRILKRVCIKLQLKRHIIFSYYDDNNIFALYLNKNSLATFAFGITIYFSCIIFISNNKNIKEFMFGKWNIYCPSVRRKRQILLLLPFVIFLNFFQHFAQVINFDLWWNYFFFLSANVHNWWIYWKWLSWLCVEQNLHKVLSVNFAS